MYLLVHRLFWTFFYFFLFQYIHCCTGYNNNSVSLSAEARKAIGATTSNNCLPWWRRLLCCTIYTTSVIDPLVPTRSATGATLASRHVLAHHGGSRTCGFPCPTPRRLCDLTPVVCAHSMSCALLWACPAGGRRGECPARVACGPHRSVVCPTSMCYHWYSCRPWKRQQLVGRSAATVVVGYSPL